MQLETKREWQTERHTDRETQTQRDTERYIERHRQRETEKGRHLQIFKLTFKSANSRPFVGWQLISTVGHWFFLSFFLCFFVSFYVYTIKVIL